MTRVFDGFADTAIDRLLDVVLLLIHEIQKLTPPLNQSAKFYFVIGFSNLRRWSHDFVLLAVSFLLTCEDFQTAVCRSQGVPG